MSWNKDCILITNFEETDLVKAVHLIGYPMLTQGSDVDFRTAFNNKGEEMPFGLIDNFLWILSPTQVEKFFTEEPSVLEKNLCKKFPNSTIIALEENSTVDSFGFSLIQKGQRVSVLNGCDGEYSYEFGDPIQEENIVINKYLANIPKKKKTKYLKTKEKLV